MLWAEYWRSEGTIPSKWLCLANFNSIWISLNESRSKAGQNRRYTLTARQLSPRNTETTRRTSRSLVRRFPRYHIRFIFIPRIVDEITNIEHIFLITIVLSLVPCNLLMSVPSKDKTNDRIYRRESLRIVWRWGKQKIQASSRNNLSDRNIDHVTA